MKQSGHLNPSEETGTGSPVTSKYGRTPPTKHGGVGQQQQQHDLVFFLFQGQQPEVSSYESTINGIAVSAASMKTNIVQVETIIKKKI